MPSPNVTRRTLGRKVFSYLGDRIFSQSRPPANGYSGVNTSNANGAGGGGAVTADDPRNVDSELNPSEYRGFAQNSPKAYDETDTALVTLVQERYKDSAMHRRPVEREWVLSCAMAEGRQWLAWDDATHRAVSLIDEEEPDRYVTHNLTRPLLAKVVSMATMTKPDANCAPDSDNPMDRAAASEGRVITAHLSAMYGGTTQTQQMAFWAAMCGVGYLKHYWDPKGVVDVPTFGPDGQMTGRKSVPAGEEQEDVLGPFDIYIDPLSKRWSDAGWIIHASVKPLSWYVERFGTIGREVEGDTKDASAGYVESYLNNGYGGASQLKDWFLSGSKRKAALCLEMWEKPTPRYPDGRLILVSGKTLLYSGPWPLKFRSRGKYAFPVSRLVYQEAVGHAYGQGLIKDVAPLQVALNRTISRIVERTEQDKLTVAIAKGSSAGADSFETDEGRNVRKIYFDAIEGGPSAFMAPPPLSADQWRLIDLIWLHMQHIAGIHDVNQGGVPSGITAGISIELLQQGDKTQLGLFTANIEQFAVTRDELRIAHYAQYASPYLPRMMGLDDSGNPETARRRAMAFRALTGGGSCSVYVVPGSATPKSPAGQKQEVIEDLKAGLFGPPNTPQAATIAVRMLSMSQSSMVLDALYEQIRQEQANQPSPADLQAQQAQQQAALQAQQQEAQQQTLQMQIAAKAQEADIAVRSAAQMEALKAHSAQEQQAQKIAGEIQKLMVDKHTASAPSLTGSMDPTAVVDWERKAFGIVGKVPPPPKPAGSAGTPKFTPKK